MSKFIESIYKLRVEFDIIEIKVKQDFFNQLEIYLKSHHSIVYPIESNFENNHLYIFGVKIYS